MRKLSGDRSFVDETVVFLKVSGEFSGLPGRTSFPADLTTVYNSSTDGIPALVRRRHAPQQPARQWARAGGRALNDSCTYKTGTAINNISIVLMDRFPTPLIACY